MHSVKLDGGNISKSVARVYCAPAVVFLGPIQNFVLNGAESIATIASVGDDS